MDGHAAGFTLVQLGYRLEPDGRIGFDGDNSQWSGNGRDLPWTPTFEP